MKLRKIFSTWVGRVAPSRVQQMPVDLAHEDEFMELYDLVAPYSMTSPERLYNVYQTVKYVVTNDIPGDFVECGVWRGGCCMMMAYTLNALGVGNRKLYLFDTFEGMPPPSARDVSVSGEWVQDLLDRERKSEVSNMWCIAGLEDVKSNLMRTGYNASNIIFIKGMVEHTIPFELPSQIAFLRLDTDWYESTLHELTHCYPRVALGGVVVIDDYGHWQGAKLAVDEYFHAKSTFLHRIDYTGRCILKMF